MKESLFLTTYKYQDEAIQASSDCGGLVLSVGSTVVDYGQNNYAELITATAISWNFGNQSNFNSYNEARSAILNTKIFESISLLQPETFVISLSELEIKSTKGEVQSVVNFVAEKMLNRNDFSFNVKIY